ncbi:hypothetical protein ACLEJW_10025 [Pseudomonas sp. SMSB3]|uniref:hypothetical protein n=1 Tax=unclassified Pseudomonas TaxID=196821 RepID=UPI0028AB86A4|nr:hypothetical protein [Pseudomonas sp.]
MYKLPDDFGFMLLSECYLEMICYGAHLTRLDFSRPQIAPGVPPYKVSICVKAGLTYQVGDISGKREFTDSSTSAPLLDLLLKEVVLVEEVEGASLQISFDSCDKIVIQADCGGDYESYSIYLDSGDVIVGAKAAAGQATIGVPISCLAHTGSHPSSRGPLSAVVAP